MSSDFKVKYSLVPVPLPSISIHTLQSLSEFICFHCLVFGQQIPFIFFSFPMLFYLRFWHCVCPLCALSLGVFVSAPFTRNTLWCSIHRIRLFTLDTHTHTANENTRLQNREFFFHAQQNFIPCKLNEHKLQMNEYFVVVAVISFLLLYSALLCVHSLRG